MKAVIQRVTQGSVTVAREQIATIQNGFVILLGIGKEDTPIIAETMAKKIAQLRIFSDQQGKMNLSVLDTGGSAIVVSQFTLYADTRKGNRPSFVNSAPPEIAKPLVNTFIALLKAQGVPTQSGQFGADMQVSILNDGPVTIVLEY
ncbi:MAG: D-tyrosyl-tRNA(Tyr) deacylase [Anaerolineaceae bacterium]|nr:D-tyrosyl-tRNA(Tyr) deacylase [Anaerolineaceae bacterium]